MLSYGVVLVAGLVLTILLAMDQTVVGPIRLSALSPAVLAMLGFLTRDVAIFVLMRAWAGARGDFAALALLAALYLVLPAGLHRLGIDLQFLFVPVIYEGAFVGVLIAWAQAIVCTILAMRSIKRRN
jgi:hypothetical protein